MYVSMEGKIQSASMRFASVLNNIDHQAHAVWIHMIPVLKKIYRIPKHNNNSFIYGQPV